MKKKKFPAFLVCYLFFLLTCIAVWGYVVSYVYDCLLQYEATQPQYVVEKLPARISRDGASSLFSLEAEPSRFETKEIVTALYDESVAGKKISWQQDRSSYNVTAPVYQFFADGNLIGTLTLRETSSRPLMFILSLSEWEIAAADGVFREGGEDVTITVPNNCSVTVNGIVLGAEDATGKETEPEIFQYVREYKEVPRLVEYHVEGLYQKPVVEIRDETGERMEYEERSADGHTEIGILTFRTSEIEPELADMAIQNAKRYSNFFSRDLPGCENSTRPIADMFLKDSYYLELAETYRREDMWMYSLHTPPTFENESVTNYTRYSDELFSCEVYFDKHIYLPKVNQERVDTTHTRFFYGLYDDGWKILDMQTLLD